MDLGSRRPEADSDIKEIINHIARRLTPQELKNLELDTRVGVLTFTDRMLSRYACFYFVTSLERAKEKAEGIVKMYKPLIVKDPRINRLFIEKFRGSIFVS